ncbi:MAG: flagellar basal body rod protein FlgB [Oribacterium sp.]|jgi:flagellar basal-body rod protein FlgB|nr:flagellar basal body rod protein FlgB [Oribacterium sp.]MDY6306608.1 flagellar basal body rod protein FlgB [Oribacterium sp.]MDY6315818.1 flagellar basal body rod protein FlgB [Oribacterium sp.]
MLNIYGNSVSLDERTLDLLWERQNITMNNIANVDTPNYKARFITFENALARSIKANEVTSRPEPNINKAIRHSNVAVHRTANETMRLDGNNVDMDQEQVQLAKTTYEYQYMVQSISNELSRLRSAVKTF